MRGENIALYTCLLYCLVPAEGKRGVDYVLSLPLKEANAANAASLSLII